MPLSQKITTTIIDVPDFPKPGIIYKDITPIFQNPQLSNEILDELVKIYSTEKIDAVVGLESRGFLFGMPLALRLHVPFVLIRKKNKLPRERYTVAYELEYGQNVIEMHKDALQPMQRVLIHDDVLATGGTATAAAQLVQMAGGVIAGFSFLTELGFLQGRERLSAYSNHITTFATF
ncbi:MAG: adenine phosphoribosyltransferase [Flavobacteriales bacterium]